MYTYPGSRSWDFTQAASFRPSCAVMRQSTSRAPPSSLIRVEVDGGQVAGPTASSKPGTAPGIGLGSTTNTSKSRLIASSGSADSGRQADGGKVPARCCTAARSRCSQVSDTPQSDRANGSAEAEREGFSSAHV